MMSVHKNRANDVCWLTFVYLLSDNQLIQVY